MNFIAGYLIIITKDEEQSFWLLDALLARMLPGIWKHQNERHHEEDHDPLFIPILLKKHVFFYKD